MRILLDHPLDVLDHDDGIVDHNADREHQREERDGIGRIADEQHYGESADDRHRHGHERDQRGAPIAQEQEYHQGDENDGDDQRADDLLDGRGHEHGRVPENAICEIIGEARCELAHCVANPLGDLDRIGARGLVDADRRRGRAIEAAVAVLRLRAHFHARDILHPDDGAVGIGAQHNRREFLRPRQPPLGLDVDLDLLLVSDRWRADAAQRRLNVLARDRGDDVVGGEIKLGQAIGIEPDAQGVIERPEQGRLPDASDPRQRIDDVYGGVVAQIDLVVGLVRGIDVEDLQQGGGFLANGEARARDFLRQLRGGEAHPVLHVDRVDVGIGAERKGHGEVVAAVGAAGGLIIERAVDAVDLLLDGLRYGRFHHLRIGAGIVCLHRHLRRHDVGELRDRNSPHCNGARERDDDGDDNGKPRPIDEDCGKHLVVT